MDILSTITKSRAGYLDVRSVAKLLGWETTSENLNRLAYECHEMVIEGKLVRFQKTTEKTTFFALADKHPIEGAICLYGPGLGGGSGWLVHCQAGRFGDGIVREGRPYSFSVVAACLELQRNGVSGVVSLSHPTDGSLQATFPVYQPPYFGDMVWYDTPPVPACTAS